MPTSFRRAPHRTAARKVIRGALLCGAMSGCATTRAGRGMNVSSELGDYSPAVRLAVSVQSMTGVDDSTTLVVVRVDSGVVTAHGDFAPNMPVVMRDLRISALLAEFRPAAARRDTLVPPWRQAARSTSQPLADSLRFGESANVPPLSFPIRIARSRLATANGIVFEITGAAISTPVRLATGELFQGAARGNIRVFACSSFRLDGRVDAGRAKALRVQYTSAC